MRRAHHLLALLLLASLAAGCAATATVEAFDRRMAAYIGRSEAELVGGLGVPSRAYDTPDGRRLLQYDFANPAPRPAVVPSLGFGIGGFGGGLGGGVGLGTGLGLALGGYGQPAAVDCAAIFEVRDGRVLTFTRRGEGCAAPVA